MDNIEKLEDGMKWELIETPAEDNSVYVRDYVTHLQDLLAKYEDAVLRDVGWYNQEIGIYVQVPKTKVELLADQINNIEGIIAKLKRGRERDIEDCCTIEEVIIDNGTKITEAEVKAVRNKDPQGRYKLKDFGYVLVKKTLDEEVLAIKFGEAGKQIKELEDCVSELKKQYREALEKEKMHE